MKIGFEVLPVASCWLSTRKLNEMKSKWKRTLRYFTTTGFKKHKKQGPYRKSKVRNYR
jgi:hypothetical protein